MHDLTSRERLLAALRYQEPDHVPLLFLPFGFRPPPHLAWSNPIEEAQRWLSLGVDATLKVSPPLVFHSDVTVREWQETIPGAPWPLLVKEYHTPKGILRQEVYKTEDWSSTDWPSHGASESGIRLLDDYNVVRSRKFLIEQEEDLEKLPYLLCPLSDETISQVRDRTNEMASHAQELGVLLEGWGSSGTDVVAWLCGIENMVFMAMDRPEMFSRLLDIIHQWDKSQVEVLLDTPVDMVVRRGWYEGTSFWSPSLFRRFFMPRIKELTDLAHQHDRLMAYKLSVGFMPLLQTFAEIGYDVHYFIDPVQGGQGIDLHQIKDVFRHKIAIVGGMNSAVTLEQGTRAEIRQAVFDAVNILGPDGLVLTPVDCIAASTPWESIETVIEAWKEVRG